MRITLLSANNRVPDWVAAAADEYLRRLPPSIRVELHELPLQARTKSQSTAVIRRRETARLVAAVPGDAYLVALDETGKPVRTNQIARALADWQMARPSVCLMIGGPDGLDFAAGRQPDETWSLSALTFPHALVRVILLEQLFRAWAVNAGHPYHREG